MIIEREFYLHSNVCDVAKNLLGKYLFTHMPGEPITGGMIIETEAYAGPWDKAAHSHTNRLTERTHPIFQKGGIAYLYLCYGMHLLFNIVTNFEGIPHAVLIRAITPEIGVETMAKRRKKPINAPNLASGPGTLCQALGIHKGLNGHDLINPPLWLEDRGNNIKNITYTPRIGVDYAKEDALLPWRFLIKS